MYADWWHGLKQIRALLIVLCSGRLMHHLKEVEGMSLRTVEFCVFDEADRLFEMGFAVQLREILSKMNEARQVCFYLLCTTACHIAACYSIQATKWKKGHRECSLYFIASSSAFYVCVTYQLFLCMSNSCRRTLFCCSSGRIDRLVCACTLWHLHPCPHTDSLQGSVAA